MHSCLDHQPYEKTSQRMINKRRKLSSSGNVTEQIQNRFSGTQRVIPGIWMHALSYLRLALSLPYTVVHRLHHFQESGSKDIVTLFSHNYTPPLVAKNYKGHREGYLV
jgi:hypothetical protein